MKEEDCEGCDFFGYALNDQPYCGITKRFLSEHMMRCLKSEGEENRAAEILEEPEDLFSELNLSHLPYHFLGK